MAPKHSKRSQKLALDPNQFANLLQEVAGQLPAGVQLDDSVLKALKEATNSHLNEIMKEKKSEDKKENAENQKTQS
ncbi:unnamed protein product [Caenorhabditis bovis]|uniref:Uncharacterized protein n=1 Tax=Caenorhabditis bovis TaxID=2654633 RepID=A0A8S1E7Q6_9PELO|nr:unnamed protein product [Caenorhabditis bovis]